MQVFTEQSIDIQMVKILYYNGKATFATITTEAHRWTTILGPVIIAEYVKLLKTIFKFLSSSFWPAAQLDHNACQLCPQNIHAVCSTRSLGTRHATVTLHLLF